MAWFQKMPRSRHNACEADGSDEHGADVQCKQQFSLVSEPVISTTLHTGGNYSATARYRDSRERRAEFGNPLARQETRVRQRIRNPQVREQRHWWRGGWTATGTEFARLHKGQIFSCARRGSRSRVASSVSSGVYWMFICVGQRR